jgi:hypothetical protein
MVAVTNGRSFSFFGFEPSPISATSFLNSQMTLCLQTLSQLTANEVEVEIVVEVEAEVNLRPTVSRPVCPGVALPSGTHDPIFLFCLTVKGFLMLGTLSDERTVL